MQKPQKPITRIDLENAGSGIIKRCWLQGWKEGDPAYSEDFLAGEKISDFLMRSNLEKEGFTIECCDRDHGRALRGEITRIDFRTIAGKVRVSKYPWGWTALTRPVTEETKPVGFDLEASLKWCADNGFTVRRFPGGARAWKGEVLPIRDRYTIQRMRRDIDNGKRPDLVTNDFCLDLAYDL
ncbi:MAG: hypothetical protein P4L50_03085 [Anaerolineaceae bacterium]|nr:hypothetical protein [Anaerolineaceae bacterium]